MAASRSWLIVKPKAYRIEKTYRKETDDGKVLSAFVEERAELGVQFAVPDSAAVRESLARASSGEVDPPTPSLVFDGTVSRFSIIGGEGAAECTNEILWVTVDGEPAADDVLAATRDEFEEGYVFRGWSLQSDKLYIDGVDSFREDE